jgi:hypothetical protein|nr:MAG TPA: hypothetical protein [Caudoviricetes sp.]
MENKINREVRIRFSDSEIELFNYITSKRSASGFLKDLATVEMKRENNLIKNVDEVAREILNLLQINGFNIETDKQEESKEIDKGTDFNSNIEDEFDD